MEQMESENDIKSEDLEQISNISGNLSYWSVQLLDLKHIIFLWSGFQIQLKFNSIRIFWNLGDELMAGLVQVHRCTLNLAPSWRQQTECIKPDISLSPGPHSAFVLVS